MGLSIRGTLGQEEIGHGPHQGGCMSRGTGELADNLRDAGSGIQMWGQHMTAPGKDQDTASVCPLSPGPSWAFHRLLVSSADEETCLRPLGAT